MTIRKGEAWGEPFLLVAGTPHCATDAEGAAALHRQRKSGEPSPTIALTGGLMWDLLGGPTVARRLETTETMRFPVDLALVYVNGVEHPFLGSAVIRSKLWRQGVAILNGQAIGPYRIGQRSHPNDGYLDIVRWRLSFADLPKVAKRARLGAHTPHPGIRESRADDTFEIEPQKRDCLWIDGIGFGRIAGKTVSLRIEADAGFVIL